MISTEEIWDALERPDTPVNLQVLRRLGRGRARVLVTLSSGYSLEVEVSLRRLKGQEQASMKLYRTQATWSEEELKARGLPLYWSRRWLLAQLKQHNSLSAITLLTGYPRATLNRWKARHCIQGNPRHDLIRREWASGRYATRKDLADAFGVVPRTLQKILAKPDS